MQMILCYRLMGEVTNDVDMVGKYVMKWLCLIVRRGW